MKKNADKIDIADLIAAYEELNSSYKVAERFDVSATAVKRILKNARVLRTQSVAASKRNEDHPEFYLKRGENQEWKDGIAASRIGKAPWNKGTKCLQKAWNKGIKNKPLGRPHNFNEGEWAKIKSACFNRDGFKCQECGGKGRLHAHHKIPFRVRPEGFLDMENLVTLCTDCHFDIGHKGNWYTFNPALVSSTLLKKYSLDAERLNVLAAYKSRSDSLTLGIR